MQTNIVLTVSGPNAEYTAERHRQKISKNPHDCGVDIYLAMEGYHDHDVSLTDDHAIVSFPTGIRVSIGTGFFAWVAPRSSLVTKLPRYDLIPGIIDSGYIGEYRLRFRCLRTQVHDLVLSVANYNYQRIALAQFVILPFMSVTEFNIVNKLETSGRGDKGYGSTDVKQ